MTLELLTSDLLPANTHGFFTRKGGASSGIFHGLNCGRGSSDQREAVLLNRTRVADAMGVAPQALLGVHQIHSAKVATVTSLETYLGTDLGAKPDANRGAETATDEANGVGEDHKAPPKVDALVTALPGVALSILTADCQPVLFCDPVAQVIGAAHAGWRGTLDGVLEATVDAMEALGAKRAQIHAAIGPTISQPAYEVGPEFYDSFITQDPKNARFFIQGGGDRFLFDLPALGLSRLRESGIARCEWTRHCTYADPARFYSYRRSTHCKEADYGRLISCIRL